jgi:hypothetical protein
MFRCQCLADTLVAFESHSESAACTTMSTAAKYFGAFGAGFPSGRRLAAFSSGFDLALVNLTEPSSPVDVKVDSSAIRGAELNDWTVQRGWMVENYSPSS